MLKFGRNYSLLVQAKSPIESVTVRPPFTIEFDVNRSFMSNANHFTIKIFNLNPGNRNKLRKDIIVGENDRQLDSTNFRSINLQAGYGNNMSEIVRGLVTQCWSSREGNNMITQIIGTDFGDVFANANTKREYKAGTTNKKIITDLITDLAVSGVSLGAIGDYPGSIGRGNSLDGNTTDLLREITGGGFYIDNGKAHCLRDDECLDDKTLVIDSSSGLLNTPAREGTNTYVDILFEPKVKVGQIVQLTSVTDNGFNGVFKVKSVHHHGVISDAVCGEVITTLGMTSGVFDPIAPAIP